MRIIIIFIFLQTKFFLILIFFMLITRNVASVLLSECIQSLPHSQLCLLDAMESCVCNDQNGNFRISVHVFGFTGRICMSDVRVQSAFIERQDYRYR